MPAADLVVIFFMLLPHAVLQANVQETLFHTLSREVVESLEMFKRSLHVVLGNSLWVAFLEKPADLLVSLPILFVLKTFPNKFPKSVGKNRAISTLKYLGCEIITA